VNRFFFPILAKAFSILLPFLMLFSCSTPNVKTDESADSPLASEKPQSQVMVVEAKTFEVLDSAGQVSGWGYDLYVDGKRSIHQPHIPAIAGNHPFKTAYAAQRVGDLAAAKMRAGMGLPTISLAELDSLSIKP
jgi:hypothetical protein